MFSEDRPTAASAREYAFRILPERSAFTESWRFVIGRMKIEDLHVYKYH